MEDTVLFYVANFQYVTACIAFSISKPYRQPMWTNFPLFVSLIFVTISNILLLILPASNPFLFSVFNDLDFCTGYLDHSGTCYPQYYYFMGAIILLNSVVTYTIEAFLIRRFTVKYDAKTEQRKYTKFEKEMESFVYFEDGFT